MIHHGDLFDVLPTLAAESIDACITDPPYGIGFMGKEWDTFKPGEEQKRIVENRAIVSDNPNIRGRHRAPASSPSAVEYDYSRNGLREFQAWTERWAREVFRVLKPGGYALVSGAPRAFHRLACGLEDADFEIRDCLSWLYGQGFPKSLDVAKSIDRSDPNSGAAKLWIGWGTALKPGWEPIVVARKPFASTVARNVLMYGTGGINVDACRIGDEPIVSLKGLGDNRNLNDDGWKGVGKRPEPTISYGRWPANVVLDEEAAALLDEQTGELTSGFMAAGTERDGLGYNGALGSVVSHDTHGDRGGASRFFYVAKPSREERDLGCASLPLRRAGSGDDRPSGSMHERAGDGGAVRARNFHPTVKPVELMRWLVRLVTPPGGTVLDPFTGSGTTGIACRYELFNFVGVEREAAYVAIAERRIGVSVPLFADAGSERLA